VNHSAGRIDLERMTPPGSIAVDFRGPHKLWAHSGYWDFSLYFQGHDKNGSRHDASGWRSGCLRHRQLKFEAGAAIYLADHRNPAAV
jgi:hypothetical protein